MASLSIVTDSTGYLPRALTDASRIAIVPLRYTFGDGIWLSEGGTEDWTAFYRRLEVEKTPPTTSPPPVEDFVHTYEPLLADGGSVLSVHLSSGLSETCNEARRAAEQLAAEGKGGERVVVLDSAAMGLHLGLLALAGARAAASGAGLDEVTDRVRQARSEARNWFLLDTLEFLRRGGRVGAAAAWIGSTLNIKPILTVESEVRAIERVRSRAKGVERLIELARQQKAAGADAWVVQHGAAHEDAARLVERLTDVFDRPPECVSEVGPVVGTHSGPGVLAVGTLPSRFLE